MPELSSPKETKSTKMAENNSKTTTLLTEPCESSGISRKSWLKVHTNYSIEDIIFFLGIVTALALVRARYDDIGGNRVPVFIFRNKPTLFHAFLVALNFGFTAAVVTISVRDKNPTLAQFCRASAAGCVAVAAGLLAFSAALPHF